MHLQRFTPTRTYKRHDHYPVCSKLHYGCPLHHSMHVATLCGVFCTKIEEINKQPPMGVNIKETRWDD